MRQIIIVLDPGHGGKDPGAVGNGVIEKDVTLKISLKTGTILADNYNCRVIYTRKTDKFITLSERAKIANIAKANLFCSVHVNSHGPTAHGFESYRYPGTKDKTEDLQKNVHDELMKLMRSYNVRDRGMKQQNFAVVRQTAMPAILTENLFLSNSTEAQLLKSEAFLDKIAKAHAIGLAHTAGLVGKCQL